MRIQDVKSIDTGHRQLTFGFDDQNRDNLVMGCIDKAITNNGFAVLHEIITMVKLEYDIPEAAALQTVFWSALELKIHLKIDNKSVNPLETKKNFIQVKKLLNRKNSSGTKRDYF